MAHSLRILADHNIPVVREAFARLGTVRTCPGRSITRHALQDVDVLLVRSVTPVDAAMLRGTPVQFVGSATAGTDHVNQADMAALDVAFAHAPGANAPSVVDYVIAALLQLAVRTGSSLQEKTLGIVGCGHIGGRLATRASALGITVVQNDPPLADAAEQVGQDHPYIPLSRVLETADILTLHTPLTHDGPYPTHHIIDAEALDRLGSDAWLLNTSRGAVVDNAALRDRLVGGRRGPTVLDVWEHEPTPDPDVLHHVDIATPHIAGYALDGKIRGTRMLYDALCTHLGVTADWPETASPSPHTPDALRCTLPDPRLPMTDWLHALAQQAYAIADDDARLRPLLHHLNHPAEEQGAFFRHLRKTYPRRREMQMYHVPSASLPPARRTAVTAGLQMALASPSGT